MARVEWHWKCDKNVYPGYILKTKLKIGVARQKEKLRMTPKFGPENPEEGFFLLH
jgi:hypothetical protein